jgi:hypothetical protein
VTSTTDELRHGKVDDEIGIKAERAKRARNEQEKDSTREFDAHAKLSPAITRR